MQLSVVPMATKTRRGFCVRFLDSAKEVVSGIELQNRLSTLVYGVFGTSISLAEVSLRFPFPLEKGEWAELYLTLDYVKRLNGNSVRLAKFSVAATGVTSARVVLKGGFITVVG